MVLPPDRHHGGGAAGGDCELSEEDKANAPFFLPYLSGERTPHNDPDARGIFWGMTHASLRAQLGYAVLEGVSFGINDACRH